MEDSLTPTLILLNIIGGVCLLLWGLNGVKKAVQRVFGHNLHEFLASATKNRFQAFFTGLGITFLLQSSTATALLMAALCGSGVVAFSAGVAIMLGADVGTALLAFVFSLNIKWLAPFLIFVGFVFYNLYYRAGRKKHIGSLILSLGIMLLSLDWIRQSTDPLTDSAVLPVIIQALERDMFMAILLAAILTWLAHSSLAIILLLVSFAASGLISADMGVSMVLGANLGGAFAPIAATVRDKPEALQIPLANLLMRLAGVILAAPFIGIALDIAAPYIASTSGLIIGTHIGFNLALAVLFLPFIGYVTKFTARLIPKPSKEDDPSRPQYLNTKQLDTPSLALTSAARETLRMSDIVQSMLRDTIKAVGNNDEALVRNIRDRDDIVDRLYSAIKLYLAKISEESLDKEDSQQYLRIMGYCINLEAAGDVIDKSLMDMAYKKINKKKTFSENGWKDIQDIHAFVDKTMNNAHSVFMNDNADLARKMIEGKDWIRKAENDATEAHLERIREGIPETIDTSSLHLDIIRDFRRINSHISTVAYPILEESGLLYSKRLKKDQEKGFPAN